MAKVLSEYDKERRKGNKYYFKNGKPKKKAMLCRSREYISQITRINGYYDIDRCCCGRTCRLYITGCDDKGRAWE